MAGQRTDRAKDYLKCALKYGCLLLVILSIVIVVFSKQLSGFFVNSSDVADIVGVYFFIVGIGYLLNTITNSFLVVSSCFGKPAKKYGANDFLLYCFTYALSISTFVLRIWIERNMVCYTY